MIAFLLHIQSEILTPDAGDWSTTFRQNSFFVLQSRKFPEIAYGEIVKKM